MRHRILAPLLAITVWIVFALGFGLRPAFAHDAHYSSVTLRLEADGVRVSLALPMEPFGATSDHPADAARVESLVLPTLALTADGQRLPLRITTIQTLPDKKAILAEARAEWITPPRAVRVHRLFPADPQARTMLTLYERGSLQEQEILDAGQAELDYQVGGQAKQSAGSVFARFVGAGVHHIFIGPDHILFIIGLLLLGGSLKRLLKIITAFTLAHSITLALAALNILNPSPSFIEPMIALSIVCIGADNLATRPGDRDLRAWLAFGFGFIHGFGFANVLRESELPREALGLSLFSFNLGVEIGQACIVLAVAPLLALLVSRAPTIYRRVVLVGSVGVAVMGTYWFVERVLVGG